MKVQISIDDELVARIDQKADEMYTSRSGFITLATSTMLKQYEIMDMMKELTLAVRKIADVNAIDDDARHKIEDFERLAKMIMPSK